MADLNEKRYLDQVGLSALWEKIKNRDIELSGAVSSLSSEITDRVIGLDTSAVSGVLPLDKGGLGSALNNITDVRNYIDVYSKEEIESLFSASIVIKTPQEWESYTPTDEDLGKIFYVGPVGSGEDKYDEYIITKNGGTYTKLKVGEHSLNLSGYVDTVSVTGTGNAITNATKNGNTLTLGKDETFTTKTEFDTFSGDMSGYVDDLSRNIDELSGKIDDIGSDFFSATTTAGSGNAFTTVSSNGNTITLTKGETFLPSAEFDNFADELENALDALNDRIDSNSADISAVSSYVDRLNGRLETVSSNVETIAGGLTYTSSFNAWQTITGITSTSAGVEYATTDIPSITKSEIDALDDNW